MIDPADEERRGGGIKVLVVEDEYFIGVELRRVLIDRGFQVLGPLPSNEDALDQLERERPDIAVLDVHLAGTRVTPVAARLRHLGIPFVLATASPAHELASDPVLADAINVGKPTEPHRLSRTLLDLVT